MKSSRDFNDISSCEREMMRWADGTHTFGKTEEQGSMDKLSKRSSGKPYLN